jgi:flagellar biogenesis protein FliO
MNQLRIPSAADCVPGRQRGHDRLHSGRIRLISWGCLLAWVIATPVWAQPGSTTLPDTGTSVLRVFGAFLLVLALFFGGVWVFRNWQRFAARQNGAVPKLNVLEVKPLGHRYALYVIGYERQRMLVASSPTGIALLSSLPQASEEEAGTANVRSGFADSLQKALGRRA